MSGLPTRKLKVRHIPISCQSFERSSGHLLASIILDSTIEKSHIHKKIVATKDAFVNEDFDAREAMEAALDKRKFLIGKILPNRRVTDTNEDNDSN